MTELSFASSFLQRLDSLPTKILPDHVEDPKTYPSRSAYILPKHPRPFHKPKKSTTIPGQEPTIALHLKSPRNPPIDLRLPSLPPTTSLLQIKETLSTSASIPVQKLRLLYNKKPVQDSKILRDLIPEGEENTQELELSVMVMGGAASVVKKTGEGKGKNVEEDQGGVQMGHGKEVLKTDEFWSDLQAFLVQRLKDEGEGKRLAGLFRRSVE